MKEEQNLFRMSFVLQDNNVSTLETSLVKIIEAILYSEGTLALDFDTIANKIKAEYELDFSTTEIKKSIEKKEIIY